MFFSDKYDHCKSLPSIISMKLKSSGPAREREHGQFMRFWWKSYLLFTGILTLLIQAESEPLMHSQAPLSSLFGKRHKISVPPPLQGELISPSRVRGTDSLMGWSKLSAADSGQRGVRGVADGGPCVLQMLP